MSRRGIDFFILFILICFSLMDHEVGRRGDDDDDDIGA
jgi:hypothetical protein